MVTTITNPTSLQKLAQLTAYRYDQLNRIMQMKAYGDINLATNAWGSSAWTDMFKNTFAYGANGNLKTLQRYDSSGTIFDNFAYHYLETDNHLVQNRLYHINDTCANNRSAVDIDDQGTFSSTANTINIANNYGYDEIGNLMRDSTEQIVNIEWTVYGKVKTITRDTNSIKPDLEFLYDPTGNRIAKIVKPYNHVDEPLYWITTYYTRDAQGNIMATYKHSNDTLAETPSFMLMEHDIYGSSRIGTDNSNVELISAQVDASSYTHTLGLKQFELTNHLGNVLATVSDKKIQVDANSDGTVDYYKADIVSAQDYHPFGSLMAERSFSTEKYKFGMNGQLKDDEITGVSGANTSAMFWEYDSRSGRRWNLDPIPTIGISDYACYANSPILFADPLGNKFEKKSDERKANRIERKAQQRLVLLQEKIKSTSITDVEKKEMQSSINDLSKVSNEIQEMREAETVFNFERVNAPRGEGFATMDQFGTVTMSFTTFSSMVHETKHGYQHLIGELSGLALYDITDETAAYQRGYAFGSYRDKFKSFADITDNKVRSLVDPITGNRPYDLLPNGYINYLSTSADWNKAVNFPGSIYPQIKNSNKLFMEVYPQFISKDLMHKVDPKQCLIFLSTDKEMLKKMLK